MSPLGEYYVLSHHHHHHHHHHYRLHHLHHHHHHHHHHYHNYHYHHHQQHHHHHHHHHHHRIIHNIKLNNHISISSLQHKLQILSLKDRAFLKSVSLVHNLIYSNTSNILSERTSYYRPLSSLRSAKSVKLNLPKYNYETIMGRSFCVSAPTNWNKLPTKLRCEFNYNIFRRKVKLFLLH